MTVSGPGADRHDEWERLANAATPGPWTSGGDYAGKWPEDGSDPEPNYWRCWQWLPDVDDVAGLAIVDTEKQADAEFIAAARQAVPALVAECQQLREENERLKAGQFEPFIDKGDLINLDEMSLEYCDWGNCREAGVVALRWAGIEDGFLPVCMRHMMERVVGVQVVNDVMGSPDV